MLITLGSDALYPDPERNAFLTNLLNKYYSTKTRHIIHLLTNKILSIVKNIYFRWSKKFLTSKSFLSSLTFFLFAPCLHKSKYYCTKSFTKVRGSCINQVYNKSTNDLWEKVRTQFVIKKILKVKNYIRQKI